VGRNPAIDFDHVRAMLVHDDRRALVLEIVDSAPVKFVALGREVGNGRRDIRASGEPRLHGMFVRRDNVDQMSRREGIEVSMQNGVHDRICER
jgi:hypothetical protein